MQQKRCSNLIKSKINLDINNISFILFLLGNQNFVTHLSQFIVHNDLQQMIFIVKDVSEAKVVTKSNIMQSLNFSKMHEIHAG